MNQQFTEEKTHMADKQMERYTALLVIGKMTN